MSPLIPESIFEAQTALNQIGHNFPLQAQESPEGGCLGASEEPTYGLILAECLKCPLCFGTPCYCGWPQGLGWKEFIVSRPFIGGPFHEQPRLLALGTVR